jgi:Raf kinase inhibitor-like YbhB/YbcL family protein
MIPFALTSDDFKRGEMIPHHHTCQGNDVSPALTWSDPPPGTQSFALICDDPDAPGKTWVHWVLYRLPAHVRGLPQDVEKDGELSDGSRQGKNDFGNVGYGGPCPPVGHGPHRYFFKIYALDNVPELAPGATKDELLAAMEGHILADADLMGRYERKQS